MPLAVMRRGFCDGFMTRELQNKCHFFLDSVSHKIYTFVSRITFVIATLG